MIHINEVYIYEELSMQVSKWGNSLAIRLPAAVVKALKLHAGDDIEVVVADERVFQVKKKPGTKPSSHSCGNTGENCRPISSLTGTMQMPAPKAFIDTNILIYLLSADTAIDKERKRS